MARFLIEGEWLGYSSSQDHIVHREITTDSKLAMWCANNYGIAYTDGTTLRLSSRQLGPRESIHKLVNGYGSLIRDCFKHDVTSGDRLHEESKP